MAKAWAEQSLMERIVSSVERVQERLFRAAAVLEAAGVPYAVIGGNAVADWVARIDPRATRNTQDVDVLLRRTDLDAASRAMAAAGFTPYEPTGIPMFIDGPDGSPRDAVHVIIANEKVRATDAVAAPDVDESEPSQRFRVIELQALLRMKLTAFRRKDQVHIEDMLSVGLIDGSWKARLPADLAERLQHLIDTPQG